MIQYVLWKGIFYIVAAVMLVLPVALGGHYKLIGPRTFPHGGKHYTVFSVTLRIIHWIAAISCTGIVLSGLVLMAANAPWLRDHVLGKSPVRVAWSVHAWCAVFFGTSTLGLFLRWAFVMRPMLHDIKWMLIFGNYLSKQRRPVPAHMFNAGQKMWFWLITVGGGALCVTGFMLNRFMGSPETLKWVGIVHNVLATAVVAMLLVHIYMACFAIQGSLFSMINGMKGEAELAELHGIYLQELVETGAPSVDLPDPHAGHGEHAHGTGALAAAADPAALDPTPATGSGDAPTVVP